jgi:colanic acid biosynthesis protein WcaH
MSFLSRQEFLGVVERAPLVSMDLVVWNGNAALLGRRTNRPAQGYWFVPGGRIRKNEPMRDAFSRIARQELGVELTFDQAQFLGVYEHFYDDNVAGAPSFGTHYVSLGYVVRVNPPIDSLPAEQHGDYKWCTRDFILNSAEVHANTKAYFRDFTEGSPGRTSA